MKFVRGFLWTVWFVTMAVFTVLTFYVPDEWIVYWDVFVIFVLLVSTSFVVWIDKSTRKDD